MTIKPFGGTKVRWRVIPDDLTDELLDAEIPCGGILNRRIARSCSRPAVLRSFGHGCMRGSRPELFKCLTCWQDWYTLLAGKLALNGVIRCRICKRVFTIVEAFSDYRPF